MTRVTFLTGTIDAMTTFGANDFRTVSPRFTSEARTANAVLNVGVVRLVTFVHRTVSCSLRRGSL